MKFAGIAAAVLLLCAAVTAQAGMLHPALEAKLSLTPSDEPVSVIVHLAEQAPIASLDEQLRFAKASRAARHRQILEALQSVTGSQDALKAELTRGIGRGGVLGYTSYWITNCLVVLALPAEIRAIAARSDVEVVELNIRPTLIEPASRPDPSTEVGEEGAKSRGIGVTPGLRAIRAPEVWYQLGYNGAGRLIGSCDTGVYGSHVALATRWRGYQGANPWQECWLDVLGTGTQFPNDGHGHGTHTTGTMTGLGATTQDTIGVAWGAQWIACNAINQNVNPGFDSDILASYQWFTDPDGNPNTLDDVPDVVQNSWGINEGFSQTPPYTDCDTRWWNAIDNCEAAGVVTCWSAGNEGLSGSGSLRSPADRATSLTNCFSVGMVSAQAGQPFPYAIDSRSSRGPSGCNVPADQRIKPEVVAPGVNVYSSVNSGGYQAGWDGTSMAGPHVAGIVALIRQANPDLDVVTIKEILLATARDEGTAGDDNTYGMGFVDAQAAVIAATVGFGRLEGHVFNASWGNAPIQGARVTLLQSGAFWQTDAAGFYSGSAAGGSYTAEASRAGFATQQATVAITSNETTVQNFYLVDNAGPVITGVTRLGATDDTVGPYAVEATVSDPSTVASVRLFYRVNGGSWTSLPMALLLGFYTASLPGQPVNTQVDYYVQATDGPGQTAVDPPDAPLSFYSLYVTQVAYAYTAETPDAAWQLGQPGDAADAGIWIRDNPIGTDWNGVPVQPEDDHTPDPGVACFVTANGTVGGAAGAADVDHGCTTLRSPNFDLSAADQAFAVYWRWYGENGNSTDDEFAVDVSSDGGASWAPLERVPSNQNSWQRLSFRLNDYITLTNQVTFRFVACDNNTQGLVEAAIDDFSIQTFVQDPESVPGAGTAGASGLDQNRPNPFRPGSNLTSIRFRLSNTERARVEIFDAAGRLVRSLHDGTLPAGPHALVWNGLDNAGQPVSSGVYFYRLKAGAYEQTRNLTVVN